MNHKKVKAEKGIFARLVKMVFKENKWQIIVVLLFMMISTFTNVKAMSTIQDILAEAIRMVEVNSNDFSGVATLIVTMIILYGSSILFGYFHQRIMVNVGQDSLTYIRENLFDHMLDLPLNYFDTNKHGDIMSRYTNDVDATRQMISQSLPQLIVSMLMMVGYLVAMFTTSWVLSIFTVIFSAILIIITRVISMRSKKYFVAQQKNVGALNGYIEEMIEGQKVVKVFRHEEEAIKDFTKLNRNVTDAAYTSMSRSGMLIPITVNMGYLSFAIAAMFGAFLVLEGLLSVPGLVAYLLFTRQFTGPVNQM
ncbi:MAG: ABC transporter ATP-binding protein, partial [Acholeplasma sp.]|nr:ABC transporter ATP-binding protein [Acholeplasma sp.]